MVLSLDFRLEGYEFLHIDCSDRIGGGVAALCKSSAHPVMSSSSKYSSYGYMHVRLKFPQSILNLVVVYCPPQAATIVSF